MWNLEGQYVTGLYLQKFPVSGEVINSRVKYGGSVQHTVKLSKPIEVFGAIKLIVLLDDVEVKTVTA